MDFISTNFVFVVSIMHRFRSLTLGHKKTKTLLAWEGGGENSILNIGSLLSTVPGIHWGPRKLYRACLHV